MREFFKKEMERLHLTTGLQQYAKLNDDEFTELLDLLCAKCAQFVLIPDAEKQKFIREAMITDTEFLGFNAKILHKWLNILNRGYITTQADYQESKSVAPPYADYVKSCEESGITPASEEDYDKPIKPGEVLKYVEKLKQTIGSTDIAEEVAKNRAAYLEEKRQRFGVTPEKRAEIQEERMRRLWERDCFNDDGSQKDSYLPYEAWKELRFEAKETAKRTQGKSQFSESDLTPLTPKGPPIK